MVDPEVRAAALLARQRRGGHQSGERVRVLEQPPQPGRVALEARVAPDRLARAARAGGSTSAGAGAEGVLDGGPASPARAAR